MKKFIIDSGEYKDDAGGTIVLHRLCHYLNEKGYDAYLIHHGFFRKGESIFRLIFRWLQMVFGFKKYKLAQGWNTKVFPLYKKLFDKNFSNYIIVYPEVIIGNPFGAKNIVRLLMHNPGYFTNGLTNYGENELIFRYSNSFARDFKPNKGSIVSEHLINISTWQECYNLNDTAKEREGYAYIVRKGINKNIQINLPNAIKIDGMSHEECAKIFKKVKAFISLDAATAYSSFAIMCGCPSVILLGEDETPSTYRPDPNDAKMFVYSIEDIDKFDFEYSYNRLINKIKNKEANNNIYAQNFIDDCRDFFKF